MLNYFISALIIFLFAHPMYSQNSQNIKYNTVYLEDLCSELSEHPDALLLDVRSPDEYNDTSSVSQLNLGSFKNSINMDTEKFEDFLPFLNPPKNKRIYVYCSHSNRSRVCSDYLVEQGYTNVYNVNGGISEWILEDMNCNGIYTNNLAYKLFSPQKVNDIIAKNNVQLIDIRPKDEYDGTSPDELKNVGRIKNSINIPYHELESRISEIDRNKQIILYDFDCKLSPKAAKTLSENGYTNTGILIFGLASWINKTNSDDNTLMENLPLYKNLSIEESVNALTENNKDKIILDIRSEKDYNNNNDMVTMRVGRIKNAINIPAAEFDNHISDISKFKDKKILVYDNISGTSKSAEVCKKLIQNGFKNVNNVFCGIYKIAWSKKNIKGFNFPDELILY